MWFARVAVVSDWSGATQGRPRSHADGPRRGPERLQTAPRGLRKRREMPRRAWERLRGDFGAILGGPGPRKTAKSAVLSSIFVVFAISQGSLQQRPKKLQKEPPGRPASFPSLARGPLDRRKHCSKSLVKRSFATAAVQMCRGHCPLNL